MKRIFLSIGYRMLGLATWAGYMGKLLIGVVMCGLIAYGIYWGLDLDRLQVSPVSTGQSAPIFLVAKKPAGYYDENSEEDGEEEIYDEEYDDIPDSPGVYEYDGRQVRVVEARYNRWIEPDYREEEIDEDYDIYDHIRR